MTHRVIHPAAAALLALLALLSGGAAGCRFVGDPEDLPPPEGTPLPPRPSRTLREKEAAFTAQLLERHLTPEGILDYHRPKGPRPPDEPSYGRHADGPFHSGILLGTAALRYGATRERAHLALVSKALDGLELLEAVTGRPGLFARHASRDPAPFDPARMHPRDGRRAAPPLEAFVWRGDVSKDQYAGVAFGLGAVMAHVDNTALRARAAGLARRIAAMLEETGERLIDPGGERTTHGSLAARYGPVRIALHAAIVLAIAGVAADPDVPGGERAAAYASELRRRGWDRAVASGIFNATILTIRNHVNDNMSFLALYGLIAPERDPRRRALYRKGLERAWAGVAGEGTPFFDLVYAACGGARAAEVGARGRAFLKEFPDEKRAVPIDLRPHLGSLGVGRRCLNNRKGVPRVDGALPLYLRGTGSMLWVRDPDLLVSDLGAADDAWLTPTDFLEAYWLGRAHGLIAPED